MAHREAKRAKHCFAGVWETPDVAQERKLRDSRKDGGEQGRPQSPGESQAARPGKRTEREKDQAQRKRGIRWKHGSPLAGQWV